MRRLLVAAAGAAALAAALALPASRANFASSSVTRASAAMDQTARYLQLLSDAADTTPLTGYADKRNSNPLVRAATGADDTLAVALGGYKNTNVTPIPHVFAVRARNPLPAGVTAITVTAALLPDPGGKQPLTGATFSPLTGAGSSTSVTLAPGDKRWLDLSASMKGSAFPGNNLLYHPVVRVTVRHAGYAGTFLSYDVPVAIWDGNGSGP